MTLAEALSNYLAADSSSVSSYSHQELHRFGRAVGLERSIQVLTPPEVARYAEGVISAGGDIQGRLAPLKEFLAFLKKKGLSSHSLAPHVKIPRATARAAASAKAAFEVIPMTAAGINALQDELSLLKSQRLDIVESIRLAAADKDFRENAPLDAARENQGKAEGRIREIGETLRPCRRHRVAPREREGCTGWCHGDPPRPGDAQERGLPRWSTPQKRTPRPARYQSPLP